jgi:hypothetical protein
MRALVIFNREYRPAALIALPESTPLLKLEIETQRLDAAGVEYEVLDVSRDMTLDDFVEEQIAAGKPDPSTSFEECG